MNINMIVNRFGTLVLSALVTTFLAVVIYMAINTIGINPINPEHSLVIRASLIVFVYTGSYFTLSRFKIFEKISGFRNVKSS